MIEQSRQLERSFGFSQAIWMFPAAFIFHVAEEWPNFITWAQQYASTAYSSQDYVRIHLAGIVVALLSTALITHFKARPLVFLWFAFIVMPSLFWNMFFHACSTLVFHTYSPGTITAIALYPIVFYLISNRAINQRLIARKFWIIALWVAGIFHTWEVGHNVFRRW
jgi:hypothetical protein